jgi:hypothetical protein
MVVPPLLVVVGSYVAISYQRMGRAQGAAIKQTDEAGRTELCICFHNDNVAKTVDFGDL